MNDLTLLAIASDWTNQLFARPDLVVTCVIAVVAIIGAVGYKITVACMRHRERIAKIERGVDPDVKLDAPHNPPTPK